MAEEPLDEGLFSPADKAAAVLIAAEQFAAEGIQVQLGENGSLQVSVSSLREWIARHSASTPPIQTDRRCQV